MFWSLEIGGVIFVWFGCWCLNSAPVWALIWPQRNSFYACSASPWSRSPWGLETRALLQQAGCISACSIPGRQHFTWGPSRGICLGPTTPSAPNFLPLPCYLICVAPLPGYTTLFIPQSRRILLFWQLVDMAEYHLVFHCRRVTSLHLGFLTFLKVFFFWLHWVFVAVHELSLVAASGDYSSLQCMGFSL